MTGTTGDQDQESSLQEAVISVLREENHRMKVEQVYDHDDVDCTATDLVDCLVGLQDDEVISLYGEASERDALVKLEDDE